MLTCFKILIILISISTLQIGPKAGWKRARQLTQERKGTSPRVLGSQMTDLLKQRKPIRRLTSCQWRNKCKVSSVICHMMKMRFISLGKLKEAVRVYLNLLTKCERINRMDSFQSAEAGLLLLFIHAHFSFSKN